MFDRSESTIARVDPEVWAAMQAEDRRQEEHIELIASENYASPAVMQAQGSQLTNKYAEGYPGKRYYGGCENVDVVEQLAIDRIKKLFGAENANVQPNSGSQANQAVFFGLHRGPDFGVDAGNGGFGTVEHGSPLLAEDPNAATRCQRGRRGASRAAQAHGGLPWTLPVPWPALPGGDPPRGGEPLSPVAQAASVADDLWAPAGARVSRPGLRQAAGAFRRPPRGLSAAGPPVRSARPRPRPTP